MPFFSLFIRKLQFFIPMHPRRTSKLKEKPSALKREHPALQIKFLNFFNFCWLFLPFWIRNRIPDHNADPDPKHYYYLC